LIFAVFRCCTLRHILYAGYDGNMKNKEDLFQIIKALSKSEKRYFTLDAQKAGRKDSKYMELFQVINDQDDYDEAILRERFGANLPSDKAYLYEAILRSMRDYHSARSLSARIKERMLDARFLYERGLLEQSERRLDEARQLARDLDDQLALLELNIQQRHLAKSVRRKNYRDELKSLILEKDDHLAALSSELNYMDTADELFVEILRNFQLQNPYDQAALRSRMAVVEQAPPGPERPKAHWRYLLCMAMYHQLLGEFEQVFHYYSRVVDWWDERPANKKEDFYLYIIDVSNLLHAYSVREQYERIPAVLDRLEREEPESLHAKSLLFQKSAVYRLMYFINMGVSEGVERFVTEMERGLDKYEIKAGTRNALIVNVSILLFVQGRFKACVNWAQKLIRDKSGARADIRTGAWILQLMAVLGVADVDQTESVLRATARYLVKAGVDKQNSFEYAMLNFAKKIAQALPSEEKKLLAEWRSYINDLRAGGAGKVSMGLDELALYWINSRLEKTPIIQQIRQQREGKK
jgi:hypothetical protein